MTNTIMIIEDDHGLRRLLEFLLRKEGFVVASFQAGEPALDALASLQPDLLLLDWLLPQLDGIEVCRRIRVQPAFDRLPIVCLSVRDQAVDRLEALTAGADAFLTKPFESTELILTIRSLLRLTQEAARPVAVVAPNAELQLDPARFMVHVRAETVQLTRSETAVLRFLLERPGEVYSASEIATSVLGPSGGARSIDAIHAHVRNLRAKIERDPKSPSYIVTVGRKGYSFATGAPGSPLPVKLSPD